MLKHECLKVALIDDDPNTITRYKRYISESEHLELIGTTYTVEGFLNHISTFSHLNLLLLDINLPGGMNGLKAIRKVKKKLPKVDIVMLTTISDDDSIFKALRAGAIGYLIKDMTQSEFQKSLLSIRDGGAPISSGIARKIVNYFNPPKLIDDITQVEKEVLHNLMQGLSYQEIGNQMDITINSVRHHIRNIYKKLQVNSRTQIINRFKNFF